MTFDGGFKATATLEIDLSQCFALIDPSDLHRGVSEVSLYSEIRGKVSGSDVGDIIICHLKRPTGLSMETKFVRRVTKQHWLKTLFCLPSRICTATTYTLL